MKYMTQYKSDLLRRLHILECEIPSLKKILENKEKQLKLIQDELSNEDNKKDNKKDEIQSSVI